MSRITQPPRHLTTLASITGAVDPQRTNNVPTTVPARPRPGIPLVHRHVHTADTYTDTNTPTALLKLLSYVYITTIENTQYHLLPYPMPYGRRNYRRKRTVSKVWAKSKTGAKSQASQIVKLQKQISSINRKVKDRAQYVQFQKNQYQEVGHSLAPVSLWQPAVFNAIEPSVWTPIFQTDSSDYTNKFRGRSIGIEHMIQLENPPLEGDPVTCTLFTVSLRKETAQQFLQDSAGVTSLSNGLHYVMTNMSTALAGQGSGMVMLNKGIFRLRAKPQRFMIGLRTDFESDNPTNNLRDNNKRIYQKLSYTNVLKSGIGTESYKDLTSTDLEPTDHIFHLLFHNAYGEQEITWSVNAVVTGRQTN